MQSAATVSLLYDTLDSLVALKLDLHAAEQHDAMSALDRRRRMCSDIDHSIGNIRAVIDRLEGRRSHALPPVEEAGTAAASSPRDASQLTAKQ